LAAGGAERHGIALRLAPAVGVDRCSHGKPNRPAWNIASWSHKEPLRLGLPRRSRRALR
jgi:hypothetical protein